MGHTAMNSTRWFATAIACLSWAGLLLSLAIGGEGRSLAEIVVGYVSSFTILTNLIAALVLTMIARDIRNLCRTGVLAATAIYLLVVILVYLAEFHGTLETTGIHAAPDALIHLVVPVLFLVFWFVCVPKGSLGWTTPFSILAFPLAYLAYMLTRGALTGVYSYPFLDAQALGYAKVAENSLALLGVYLVLGLVFTLIDCGLSRFSRPIEVI